MKKIFDKINNVSKWLKFSSAVLGDVKSRYDEIFGETLSIESTSSVDNEKEG